MTDYTPTTDEVRREWQFVKQYVDMDGYVIETAARAVAAHIWDRDTGEAPPWGALTPSEQDAVIENEQAGGIAHALASAGLLARPLPTRDEIAETILRATIPFMGTGGQTVPYVTPVHEAQADAVRSLLEGDKR